MNTITENTITVSTFVNASIQRVWNSWTKPEHITKWNQASDDWHCPSAINNLEKGGKFSWRMEAKDGSFGFDFVGVFEEVHHHSFIASVLGDGRNISVTFTEEGEGTKIVETFDAEATNPIEMQQMGWQAILDSFKTYTEGLAKKETLHFEITINAPAEIVYKNMIDPDHYTHWTSVFCPVSYFIGNWEKDSKILFVGEDVQGNKGGMVSRIKENVPNEFISIEHYGVLHKGEEITTGPEVSAWAGSLENYTFSAHNGGTKVGVDLDSNQEYKDFFNETWPKALERLKEICE